MVHSTPLLKLYLRYYLGRQGNATQQQVRALQEGQYDPLLRARFYIVGQDLALDEMMRSVASHSRRKGSVASLALVLTGDELLLLTIWSTYLILCYRSKWSREISPRVEE